MFSPSPSAAFLLPGLLHQFGNLLLTVQGQAMHVAGTDLPAMQTAVNDVVGRGSASLQIMRALMHERSGLVGDARALLSTLCELGRVAAREHNINLRALADDGTTGPVDVEHFVNACTETLQGFLVAMPMASDSRSPVVLVTLDVDEDHALVTIRFDAPEGALPFPMPFEELKSQLAASLAQAEASLSREIQAPARPPSGEGTVGEGTVGEGTVGGGTFGVGPVDGGPVEGGPVGRETVGGDAAGRGSAGERPAVGEPSCEQTPSENAPRPEPSPLGSQALRLRIPLQPKDLGPRSWFGQQA